MQLECGFLHFPDYKIPRYDAKPEHASLGFFCFSELNFNSSVINIVFYYLLRNFGDNCLVYVCGYMSHALYSRWAKAVLYVLFSCGVKQ